MRSVTHYQQTKQLECHAFVCQTPENAIVIAATLYQCLLAHMGNSQNQRPRKPRNQNGVSCISIASSSVANRRYGSSIPVNYISAMNRPSGVPPPPPPRPARMKRTATSSLSGESDNIVRDATFTSSSDQRKKKSHKTKRAPPVPNDNEAPYERKINDFPFQLLQFFKGFLWLIWIFFYHFSSIWPVQYVKVLSNATAQDKSNECTGLSSGWPIGWRYFNESSDSQIGQFPQHKWPSTVQVQSDATSCRKKWRRRRVRTDGFAFFDAED